MLARGAIALASAVAAGCAAAAPAAPRAPAPAPGPSGMVVPHEVIVEPPPPPPATPPARHLDLDVEVGCPRAGVAMPGEAPPDAAMVAFATAHRWCLDAPGGVLELELRGDGTMETTAWSGRRGSPEASRGGGTTCWAMTGTSVLVRSTRLGWDEWPLQKVDAGAPRLVWRGQGYVVCPPIVPDDGRDHS